MIQSASIYVAAYFDHYFNLIKENKSFSIYHGLLQMIQNQIKEVLMIMQTILMTSTCTLSTNFLFFFVIIQLISSSVLDQVLHVNRNALS